MPQLLAAEILSLSGVIVLLIVCGAVAACFQKLLPAVLCLAVALLLIVLK